MQKFLVKIIKKFELSRSLKRNKLTLKNLAKSSDCCRYYVYTWIACFQFLTNTTQITIYLIIFNVILFMMIWSLVMSIITPTARVPIQYFVCSFILLLNYLLLLNGFRNYLLFLVTYYLLLLNYLFLNY